MSEPLAVPCPECGAHPGQQCKRPLAQRDRRGRSHQARWRAFWDAR